MALFTRPSSWLVSPLLPLLLLYCAPGEAGGGIAVQVASNVTGFLGETVALHCSLASKETMTITQITWMKRMPDGSRPPVAIFHPKKGPSIVEPERVMFLSARLDEDPRNASLAISHLRAEDEGSYECQFATFPTGSKSSRVWLKVLARPNNSAEALKPNSTSKLQEVAKCISAGGRPPPRITWSSDVNGSTREIQKPGPQPGSVTVISLFSVEPSSRADGKNITCRVEHESLQKPDLLLLTLSLNYPPEVSISGYNGNWFSGLKDVVLTCESRSKPMPLSYEWSTATGSLPTSAEPQDSQLRITTVDHLNNTILVCNVTNALGSGQAQVTILVKEKSEVLEPDSSLSPKLIATIIIGSLVVLGIMCVVFWMCKRGCSLWPRSIDNTGACYSLVRRDCSTQNMEENSMR
ncbi:poliovirus receptor-like [Psammomys obesus]|uniref:poliovirus receptor-like n=1 Tax=Psammomys obesus TaxID=48139 RepID=UPI0024534D96|nr:poliovirus receptor-like [Psammomys obesus]